MVITDFNMPEMSGLELAREILQSRPDMPIALASGHITDDLRTQVLSMGVREVVYKPISLDQISKVLNRMRGSGEHDVSRR